MAQVKNVVSAQEMANKVVKNLPADYTYKMGYKNTLTVGEIVGVHDVREYYSGRGAKYNSSIKHGGYSYKMTLTELKKQYRQIVKEEKDLIRKRKSIALKYKRQQLDFKKRYESAQKEGVYTVKNENYGTFIELSMSEREHKYFDAKRLAKTLDISVEDADLLNSQGKTYVYARRSDGSLICLYHASLSCNNLNISFNEVSETEFEEFINSWGEDGRYAPLLGQTERTNHFVC